MPPDAIDGDGNDDDTIDDDDAIDGDGNGDDDGDGDDDKEDEDAEDVFNIGEFDRCNNSELTGVCLGATATTGTDAVASLMLGAIQEVSPVSLFFQNFR